MPNTMNPLLIPEPLVGTTAFFRTLWEAKDGAIYIKNTKDTILHRDNVPYYTTSWEQVLFIVQTHNENILLGITDEQYNDSIKDQMSQSNT